ncbi:MAG: Eco57I restriction-modification methylase domain-containing protein, partial [Caldilinea sp.]
MRDVIRTCIYGVDLNPLAVELCKVALWLEAHSPGEPLNFLDHHIKCGNAIVGFVQRADLEQGVPDAAFTTLPGDDKTVTKLLRERNKRERKEQEQIPLDLAPALQQQVDAVLRRWREVSALPERTPAEIDAKRARYVDFTQSQDAWLLNQIAAIPIAQFYLPKTKANQAITDSEYREYLTGRRPPQGQATGTAWGTAIQKRFFHWFLEFPEIMARGGFDCILGNPPYLGGQALSGTYGHAFCTYVKWAYAPAGLSDLVAYFVRRIYSLLKPNGFTAFITTNSIKDGDVRKDGLEQVLAQDGVINFAVRGVKWPGQANLVVSLVGIHKGMWH